MLRKDGGHGLLALNGGRRRCRRLIDARQYVLDSDWGEVQRADDQNKFLETHSWDDYALWPWLRALPTRRRRVAFLRRPPSCHAPD